MYSSMATVWLKIHTKIVDGWKMLNKKQIQSYHIPAFVLYKLV